MTAKQRCVCAEPNVLRWDGGCLAPKATILCEISHDVTITGACWAGPELNNSLVRNNITTAAMATILKRSVANALGRKPAEVLVVSSSFVPATSSTSGLGPSPTSIVQFDWSFSFCSVAPMVKPEDKPANFEFGFSVEAQQYAIFEGASFRVLSLTALASAISTETTSTHPGLRGGSEVVHVVLHEDKAIDLMWWLPWVLVSMVLIAGCGIVLWFRHRRRLLKSDLKSMNEDRLGAYAPDTVLIGPDGLPLQWLPPSSDSDVAYVLARRSFSPNELADANADIKEQCLTISSGEALEVEAIGSEWIYGRKATDPTKSGYVPADRVTWLGRPLGDGLSTDPRPNARMADWTPPGSPDNASRQQGSAKIFAADEDQPAASFTAEVPGGLVEATGPKVFVKIPFSADEAINLPGFDHRECLTVEKDEELKVVAAGAGWLFCHISGQPERAGYIPEDRVSWGTQDDNDTSKP